MNLKYTKSALFMITLVYSGFKIEIIHIIILCFLKKKKNTCAFAGIVGASGSPYEKGVFQLQVAVGER